MNNYFLTIILPIILTALASSGLWAFLTSRLNRKSARTKMLIGLGHDRIMALGLMYIERGWITSNEYENLYKYLYLPYKDMGGNGSADRIMKEVNKLPIRDPETFFE